MYVCMLLLIFLYDLKLRHFTSDNNTKVIIWRKRRHYDSMNFFSVSLCCPARGNMRSSWGNIWHIKQTPFSASPSPNSSKQVCEQWVLPTVHPQFAPKILHDAVLHFFFMQEIVFSIKVFVIQRAVSEQIFRSKSKMCTFAPYLHNYWFDAKWMVEGISGILLVK